MNARTPFACEPGRATDDGSPARVVANWFAGLHAPGPHAHTIARMAGVCTQTRSEEELDELRWLLAELEGIERELGATTRSVAIPLDLPRDADPFHVAALAEHIRSGAPTEPLWWTAPELDSLLDLVETMRTQGAATATAQRDFAAEWGDDWPSLASPAVRYVIERTEDLAGLLLPFPSTINRRDLDRHIAFVDRTERMLQIAGPLLDEISAMFGGDVTALPLSTAGQVLEAADRLARLAQPCEAWADPAQLANARMTMQAMSEDIIAARTATAVLANEYTEDVWALDVDALGALEDPRPTLARLRLNGRPPADPDADLARIATAQRQRAAVAQMDAIGVRSFGRHWHRHLTDVDGIMAVLEQLERLHTVLDQSHSTAQLRSLLSGPVFADPAFMLPLQDLVEAVEAWREDAASEGHHDATDFTGAELLVWVRDARDALRSWAASFDAVPTLTPFTVTPMESIRVASGRARALLDGRVMATQRARVLLGSVVDDDTDWLDLRSRIEWVASTRLLLQGRPVADAVARVVSRRAVPDPAPIRAQLERARRQVDRIAQLLDSPT